VYQSNTVHQFSHAVPGQAGPVESQVFSFDPGFSELEPAALSSSKLTFFEPQTVEAFSHNDWRQEQQADQPPPHDQYRASISGSVGLDESPTSQSFTTSRRPTGEFQAGAGVGYEPRQNWESEMSDEDTSMGESEDEALTLHRNSKLQLDEFGLIVSRQSDNQDYSGPMEARAFRAFAADHTLTSYRPSLANSPLRDKHVATVFWHFVNVTGPSISLYERHPVDPKPFFQQGFAPRSRQHIWTCEYSAIASC
jgi:hypothetical protein